MTFDERFGGLDKPAPLAPGQRDIQLLKEGGFNNDEVLAHKQQTTDMLIQGGFTAQDIDKHWGETEPDPKPFQDWVKKNLARVPANERKSLMDDPIKLFSAGWDHGNIGMLIGGKPTAALPEDAGTYEKVIFGAGQMAGDTPAMIAGAVAGGIAGAPAGPLGVLVGAGAGGNALPTAMREILLGYYDRGDIKTWRDFMARVGGGTVETTKAAFVGAASAPLGVLGGKVTGKVLGQVTDDLVIKGAPGVANVTTQALTAAGLSGALEGHVPDASDFMSGAILALVTHGTMRGYARVRGEPVLDPDPVPGRALQPETTDPEAQARVTSNLKELYRQTGIAPWEATEMIKTDPALRQELFAQGADGLPQFEKFRELAKPEPEGYRPVSEPSPQDAAAGLTSGELGRKAYAIDWDRWAKRPNEIVTRIDGNGNISADPHAIADYLQEFGRQAGFRFRVGPEMSHEEDGLGPLLNQEHSSRRRPDGTNQFIESRNQVYMPDNPDEVTRRWWGLGRSEILHHEVGHALDTILFRRGQAFATTADLSPALRAELEEVSRRFRPLLWETGSHHNIKPQELMADGIAVWLSNSSERKHMPLFEAQFGRRLDPYVKIAGRALPKRMLDGTWESPNGDPIKDNYYPHEPVKVILADGGDGGEKPPGYKPPPPGSGDPPERPKKIDGYSIELTAAEIAEKMNDMIGQSAPPPSVFALDRMYRDFVSELGPVRNIDKLLKEQGYDIDNKVNLEDMFRQTYASGSRAGYFTRYGILDAITLDEKSPASFMSAAKMIPKEGNIDHWMKYMLARRTLDKAAQGVETGFNVTEMGQIVKEWDTLYRKPTDEFNKVNRGVLEYGRDSGLFSQASIDAMTADNPAYVTFRRLIGDREQPFMGGRGFKASSPVRRMEGNDGKIIDPLLATIDNTALIVKMADRNRAIGSVVELAERHGIHERLGLKKLPPAEVKATIAAPGSDIFMPYEIKNTKGEYDPFLAQRAVRNGSLKENQFLYMREGVPEIWEATDPNLARLMRGADSAGEANMIKTVFETAGAMQRAGIVGAPDFPLKTGLRDQVTSYVLDPMAPPPFLTMLRGVFPVMTENAKFKDWFAKGGAGAALASMDADYLARDLHAIMETTGTWDGMLNVIRHPLEAAQIINEKMDAMARIGYKDHAEKHGFEPLKAATAGRKAYIDFVEKGTADVINMWAKWVPFLRPTILGHKQAGEAVVNHPLQSMARATMAVAMPTAILYAMNYLQDEYGDLPENRKFREQPRWVRDTMFVLPEVGGVRLRIPNPPLVGIPFGGFVNRALDYFVQNDKEAFEGWAIALLASSLPPFVPTLVTPFIETFAGRDLFTHNKLVPASLEKNSGYMQYTENTTEVSKALARVLGKPGLGIADISPITVDNFIASWTGTLGMTAMRAIGAPFSTNGRPWEVSDIPFVQSFVVRNPRAGAYSISNFFDAKKEADSIIADRSLALKRAGLGAENSQEVDTTLAETAARLDGIAKALRMQQNVLVAVNNSKDIPTAEKRQHIDTVYSGMIGLSRAGLEIARAFRDANAPQATGPETIQQGVP